MSPDRVPLKSLNFMVGSGDVLPRVAASFLLRWTRVSSPVLNLVSTASEPQSVLPTGGKLKCQKEKTWCSVEGKEAAAGTGWVSGSSVLLPLFPAPSCLAGSGLEVRSVKRGKLPGGMGKEGQLH